MRTKKVDERKSFKISHLDSSNINSDNKNNDRTTRNVKNNKSWIEIIKTKELKTAIFIPRLRTI